MEAFHFREQELYCEDVSIEDLLDQLPRETHETQVNENTKITVDIPSTPAYIYSAQAIETNVNSYLDAMEKYSLRGSLGYAVKANGNLHLLRLLKSSGVQVLVTVSGNEILAGLKVGFVPSQILFNGNGKQDWEIKLAVQQGVMLNIDSISDAMRISTITSQCLPDHTVKVLLRLRPASHECEIGVHPYINTSEDSKFGFGLDEIKDVIKILIASQTIQIFGLHCHLGSCIFDPNVYKYMASFLTSAMKLLRDMGIEVELLDIGGGISIDYNRPLPGLNNNNSINGTDKEKQDVPAVDEYIKIIANYVPSDMKILLEPGRSLIGNAGIIVSEVLSYKATNNKKYAIIDASMTELIRPALYGAFHQILPTKVNTTNEWDKFDVVGPVCESADFLGKDTHLPVKSRYLAIMDCGAYAGSMGSTYNMRPRPTEILITGKNFKYIRNREHFEDLVSKIC